MCYMLYLGADQAIPLIPPPDWTTIDFEADDWASTVPRLVVFSLTDHNRVVSCQFANSHVANVGSYEGCGCGFNYCDHCPDSFEDVDMYDPAVAVCRESRSALAEFVESTGAHSLYGCWAGDEELPREAVSEINLTQLRDVEFQLPERTLMRVRQDGPTI